MVAWRKKILDPIATTEEIFGGDVMNNLMDYHSDVVLDSGDPAGSVAIGTETTFTSGKLKLFDSNKSHKIQWTTVDYVEDKEIGLPTTLPVSSKLVTDTAVQTLTGKVVDGSQNTILNISDSSIAQITNKAKLNSQIAYKDETSWLTDAMIAAHTSTKITITNKPQLNTNILYKDQSNDLGDNFLEFGDIANPSNPPANKMRLFLSQTTSAASVIKPDGTIKNLEETVDLTHSGFVPLTKGGLAQFTGNSSTTAFVIPHGLGQTPDQVTIAPASADAAGAYRVTKDATNITVTYTIPPPPGGTNNVKLEWGANAAIHASDSFAAGGIATFSGNGSTKIFNIPHNLAGTVPEAYFAEAKSAGAAGDKFVTADATNVIVEFITAPATGTDNVVLVWGAGFVNEAWEGMGHGSLAAGGTATKSGNGTTTAFTIAHDLMTVPESYYVLPTSVDARGSYVLSIDATNITVTYPEPPPSGSNNLTYVWGATFVGAIADEMFTPGTADALTNKTIDADLNTITNIENADIKSAAAIAYSKLNLANSIVNADIAAHTSTKVTITAKGQLNSEIVYNDQSNTLADATNIAVGTTTGTKIGTATGQKIGFYNATPVIQGASIADVNSGTVNSGDATTDTVITDMRTKVNSLISRLEALGLIATI